jgi:hypothetical protein
MNNFVKWFGIIALVVAVGFSMTACPTEDNEDNKGGAGNAVIGAKLELSGQVYTEESNMATFTVTYPEYKENLTISDNNGGNARITSGKLSYTIETPDELQPGDSYILSYFFYNYDNVAASVSDAKYFFLNFSSGDGTTSYSLRKDKVDVNLGKTSGTITFEFVDYVYVDKDVTISGKGKTTIDTDTEDGSTSTSKTNNFSLALKEGWNAVYKKSVISVTYPAGDPFNATSSTSTETISLSNPALKWVLDISPNL